MEAANQPTVEGFESQALALVGNRDVPDYLKPLLCWLLGQSENGVRPVEDASGWIAAQRNISRATYYRHRGELVHLGLVEVSERRISYRGSLPSVLLVKPLARIARVVKRTAAGFWTFKRLAAKAVKAEATARNGAKAGCLTGETQRRTLLNGSFEAGDSDARQAFIDRWCGGDRSVFDAIPDSVDSRAHESAGWHVGRRGGWYVR